MMIEKLRLAGAEDVIQHGASWREADTHLREIIKTMPEARYIPPFDHPEIWSGAATMIGEIESQLEEEWNVDGSSGKSSAAADVVVCSVGGGGLLCGLAQGLDDSPISSGKTRIIAVETEGAGSLNASVKAGHLVTLDGITSIATSLGATRVCDKAFEYGQRDTVHSVLVTDKQAMEACLRFADEERMLVEAACGASLAVIYQNMLEPIILGLNPESRVVIIVCGGSNISMELMMGYQAAITAA